MDLFVVRFLFVLIVSATCYLIQPFDLPSKRHAGIVGAIIGVAIVLFEWKLRSISLKRLIGAAIGSVLGIFGAYLFAWSSATASRLATHKAFCSSSSCC